MKFSFENSIERHVDCIAYTCGAVVGVVIVQVIPVFRLDFFQQILDQSKFLLRGKVQPLGPDGAVFIDVARKLLAGRPGGCKIQHPALHKAHKEILLIKIEKTEIEHVIEPQPGVAYPNGVMTETLPVDFTRPIGQQPDFGFFVLKTLFREQLRTT